MIVLLVSALESTNSKTNDNASSRGGLNQMPNASMGHRPYIALQVDLGGGGEHIYIYIYTRRRGRSPLHPAKVSYISKSHISMYTCTHIYLCI